MSDPTVRVLERLRFRASLAVRCVDEPAGSEITEGLVCDAWPEGDPGARREARRSPLSGLLGFGDLPGQWVSSRRRELPGELGPWPAPAPARFVARVVDTRRRYLPVVVEVDVPVTAPVLVPLSSAPSRTVGSGWAVIQGQTVTASGAALAWVLVTIAVNGTTYRTVSDERGLFRLQAPYPEALPPLLNSVPSAPGLDEVSWPVILRVRSRAGALVRAPGTGPQDPPTLGSITGQQAARLDGGAGPQQSLSDTLVFGTPLPLRLEVVPT
jgi:hypothetical protein